MNLTRQSFESWLQGQGLFHCGHCPLEHYLRMTGASGAYVGEKSYIIDGKKKPLPGWAREFVKRIDETWWLVEDYEAKDVLAILNAE